MSSKNTKFVKRVEGCVHKISIPYVNRIGVQGARKLRLEIPKSEKSSWVPLLCSAWWIIALLYFSFVSSPKRTFVSIGWI